ncbi:MAG: hypothetical protein Q7S99_13090 [Parvibaculum sp.]|nr:hypothetical protein [Parvibaculum sp.]
MTVILANALGIPFGVSSTDSRTVVRAWSKFFVDGPRVSHDHHWTNGSKDKSFNFRSGDSQEWKHVLTDKQKDDIRKQMTGSSSLEIYPD